MLIIELPTGSATNFRTIYDGDDDNGDDDNVGSSRLFILWRILFSLWLFVRVFFQEKETQSGNQINTSVSLLWSTTRRRHSGTLVQYAFIHNNSSAHRTRHQCQHCQIYFLLISIFLFFFRVTDTRTDSFHSVYRTVDIRTVNREVSFSFEPFLLSTKSNQI